MENIKELIIRSLEKAVKDLTGLKVSIQLEHPADEKHGDYSTNVALTLFANSKFKTPLELAQKIVDRFMIHDSKFMILSRVEAVAPGFINFWLSKDYLTTLIRLRLTIRVGEKYGVSERLKNKKIMVEYAHPNTHKEMHIGHMRTLITGEALSRIFEALGAKVYRANYQGDIGPHVAKAIFGVKELIKEKGLRLEEVGKLSNKDKARFLGEAYVRGYQEYEMNKTQIDGINAVLYRAIYRHSGDQAKPETPESPSLKVMGDSGHGQNDEIIIALYQLTKKWSLDYYDEFYKRFYTRFDRLFFESEMVARGKEIVEKHLGIVFERDQGAIVFKGEPYGLHTRVFVTQAGYPTYEGKEMGNAFEEYEAFNFDKKIHIVASEQKEYFQVVFKVLELIDAEKFKDRQYHIRMGMVNLVGRKMSSRTGDVLTVDLLIDQVKEKVNSLVESGKIKKEGRKDVAEEVAIGAIKYSVLKVDTKQDVAFDIGKSVSLEGNSGPYLQYTYARTQSVLAKVKSQSPIQSGTKIKSDWKLEIGNWKLESEEVTLLRTTYRFPEVVEEAADKFTPNILCNYLFDLGQKFNLFYQRLPIINPGVQLQNHPRGAKSTREFRLALTTAVGMIIKNGLYLLGIKTPERM